MEQLTNPDSLGPWQVLPGLPIHGTSHAHIHDNALLLIELICRWFPLTQLCQREGGILLLRSEINGNPCRGWRGCLFLSFLLCFNWTQANTHHLTLWRQSSTIRGLLFLRFLRRYPWYITRDIRRYPWYITRDITAAISCVIYHGYLRISSCLCHGYKITLLKRRLLWLY